MPKQVDKYDKERQDVLNKMFQILGINESNNKFLLHELDADIDKQNKILELEPDIKKYFICGKWGCFKDPTMKRKYLSFIKNTMKNMDYNLIATKINIKQDDNTFKTHTKYIVIKNIN
jgi:hypothetical protein